MLNSGFVLHEILKQKSFSATFTAQLSINFVKLFQRLVTVQLLQSYLHLRPSFSVLFRQFSSLLSKDFLLLMLEKAILKSIKNFLKVSPKSIILEFFDLVGSKEWCLGNILMTVILLLDILNLLLQLMQRSL
jgi:hypothetical protein